MEHATSSILTLRGLMDTSRQRTTRWCLLQLNVMMTIVTVVRQVLIALTHIVMHAIVNAVLPRHF